MKVATWQGGTASPSTTARSPSPGPGQVVVDVQAAGICGTDVHATQGLFPWKPPLVLGHEYTGVVREVGRGVPKSSSGAPSPVSRLTAAASARSARPGA